MPVDWGSLINAAVAAYGGYQNASAANRPRDQRTDQTTTQHPYAEPLIAPRVESALNYGDAIMAAGPRYLGAGGGSGQAVAPSGNGAGAARPRRPNAPTTWTNARGEPMTLNAQGRAVRATGAAVPSSPSGTPQAAPMGIDAISDAVARRGLEAGNDPTVNEAQQGVRNILAGQTAGGSGYQTYNPINDYLAGELRGDVSNRTADDLLRQFLGVGGSASPGAGQPSSGGLGNGSLVSYRPAANSGSAVGGYRGGSSGGGTVPDTVGNNSSYFATQLRDLMNSQANDADLQAVIDASNADTRRGMQSDLWALDASAQGTGRFGGDMWAGLSNEARRAANEEMATSASRTRLGELENRRALYANLLGQVNTRDLGAMQDATQRYGIDASASAAGAGASAAAESARRGQDLQALSLLLNNDQYNVGALSGLGEQLSGDQLSAIGLAAPLAGIGLSGLGAANNAAGNLVGHEGNLTALRQAQIGAGTARAGLAQQRDMYNSQLPQSMLNDYLRNLGLVSGLGGSSTTQGTNVVAGAGINPWTAAGLAGASAYYGGR